MRMLNELRMCLTGVGTPCVGMVFRRPIESTQYASDAYRAELTARDMLARMSRNGDCDDNAVAERFFATQEFERIIEHDWHSQDEARRSIFQYIETWYNRKRRHSTLGYVSPAVYESQLPVAA